MDYYCGNNTKSILVRKKKMQVDNKTIPWVDMSLFLHGSYEQQRLVAHQFGEALQHIGFVAVTHIGINPQTIDNAYAIAAQYFNQAEDTKKINLAKDGHQGFVPFGTEHAKYTNIMDLKEFYQTTGPTQPEVLWPDFPGFKNIMNQLYLELENCMKHCLRATAIYLGYTEEDQQTVLSDLLGSGNSLMRILHYPPVDVSLNQPGAVRAAPHEDLGVMTVIPRATRPGLQVQNHDGDWLDVIVPEGAAIINSGDTLSRMTNGIIPSTTHRVINPSENDYSHRYSIPFFGNFPFNTMLRVLDKCKNTVSQQALPQDITFGDFLTERYKKIGLK
jgi:isopenicillin N synthase-like dioxygenase